MKVLKTLPLSLVGVGLCTAIASSPALADTTTVYDGVNCQPRLESINKIDYALTSLFTTPTSSSTNTPAIIVCPFNLSHTEGDNSSPFIKSASVRIQDAASQNDVSCELGLVAENGNVFRRINVTSSGSDPNIRKFDFPPINQRAFAAYINCTLPRITNSPRSAIGFYTITTSP